MAELVGQKHHVTLDRHDPIFMLVTVNEAMQKEAIASLAKIVTDTSDQMATAAILAENAARARSERIVTETAKWSSEQIRLAGADAAKIVVERLEGLVEQAERARRRASIAAWTSAACAGAAATILVIVFLH